MFLLGFDPGRDKCGLALVRDDGQIICNKVVSSDQVLPTIQQWYTNNQVDKLIMGDQTTSQTWRKQLHNGIPNLVIQTVDERYSTLQARDRYWELYPPQGIMRLLPKGMRLPPRPIDDIVAIILVERALTP